MNENACKKVAEHLPDEMFERGKVPMTREVPRHLYCKIKIDRNTVFFMMLVQEPDQFDAARNDAGLCH